MRDLLLSGKTSFSARALFVGNRLDLRIMEESETLASNPLAIRAENGIAVLYRHGVAVFFGVDPLYEAVVRERLKSLVGEPYDDPEMEEITVRVDPTEREGMRGNTVFISEVSVERLQIIADVLAKSIVLAEYEAKIAQNFDRIEPLAKNMEHSGRISGTAKELLQSIGAMLLSEHLMVGRVNIPEKPEVLWENPALQGLYSRLEDEFEILERHVAMERKLNLISRTAETLLDLLNNRHSIRLEWYIIILIAVEIVLSLYSIFLS
ncbi:RMD1 family protein [Oxalobacter sp. OttesenSCG-928-P03]|nr:RMD1 family protein [Oxalobacter sp. OttesenSCG-928-P03]